MQHTGTSTVFAECSGIRCTEQNLSEIDSGKVMVCVTRKDIERITLRHGIQAPHPVLQIIMGLVLTALGYFPVIELVRWLKYGGAFFTLFALLIPIAVLGIWQIISAFKRGLFLEIEQQHGSKRLTFARRPAPEELETFLSAVEREHNLRIQRDV